VKFKTNRSIPGFISCLCFLSVSTAQEPEKGRRIEILPEAVAYVHSGTRGTLSSDTPIVRRGKEPEEYRAVLVRYNLSGYELNSSVHVVLRVAAGSSGGGLNPSLAVWAVDNGWEAGTIDSRAMPERRSRITEVTLKSDVNGIVEFPVTAAIDQMLKEGQGSFLIEMRSAPGFSRDIEFFGSPQLFLVPKETPSYDLEESLRPVWRGARMVNETILPTSYAGAPARADLAFIPAEIERVTNYALSKEYIRDVDYAIEGRTLRALPGGSLPFLKYTDLYHENPEAEPEARSALDGTYLTWCRQDSSFFEDHQLAVTYRRAEPWCGPVPLPADRELPRTFLKLREKQPLKLVVFGDSICFGGNASGKCGRDPFLPRWADLVAGRLRQVFDADLDYINPSLGGTRSDWGRETADGLVAFEKPDLVIIGFGMNDAGGPVPTEQFIENVRAVMDSVRRVNPDAEFLLLMSFQPNSRWRSLELMERYRKALLGMEGPGVAVADIWEIHGYLLTHKTYWDMTGNHLNHPNDFIVRVYSQTVLARLGVQ
jgi:hypothetical protein